MSANPTPESQLAAHLLSNGRYSVLLTTGGGGYSALEGYALTRWVPDLTLDGGGLLLYVRDLAAGGRWTAGYQPLGSEPLAHHEQLAPGCSVRVKQFDGVRIRTEICVDADADAELRRVSLTNDSERVRRLELTSYAEVVLNTPAADAAHPAFSKLFVQTAYLPEHRALLGWRRLRSPGDEPLWLVHRLLTEDENAPGEPQYETDRWRFLGRGRSSAKPRALQTDAPLSGTVGSVLDPVFALRRTVEIPAGSTVRLTAVLGAAHTRSAAESILERFSDPTAVSPAFAAAAAAPPGAERALGLPETWRSGLRISSSSALIAGDGGSRSELDGASAEPARGRAGKPAPSTPEASPPAAVNGDGPGQLAGFTEPLQLFNGMGGFSEDGREYVIRLSSTPAGLELPPLPWINVIANEELGFLASERGAGYTWSVNSRENRLTPWRNDPVTDPHGEALYVRDGEDGTFWSPTPGPCPAHGEYEVRHGFGCSRYLHTSHDLEQEVCQFVPRRDPVKIVQLRVTNRADRRRYLDIFSYAELVLGATPWESRAAVETELDPKSGAIFAGNRLRGEFAERVAFAAVAPSQPAAEIRATTDRTTFVGKNGSVAEPAVIRSGATLDGKLAGSVDPCAAFQVRVEISPGESVVCAFLLGEAENADFARAVIGRYRDTEEIGRSLDEVRRFWSSLLSMVQVETPVPALDFMINGWLNYQNLSCRMWGRSALYQSGGAFGYRDQLQDSSALLYLQPAFTRRQILLHAAHQFVEGDVLHWWHPPASKGIRTRFSDDLLWLPYIACFYVEKTGDASLLDEQVRFLTARQLEPGEDEIFVIPEDSGETADVYEHCCRALDRSLTQGAHGLPLIGVGDWNDGMNRVGREGRGESVWLGFFLYSILDSFLPWCERRGDPRVERYREYRARLGRVLNDTGWDGAWYRRAYYDDGSPLGSAENDECRIDTVAQAWAVLSGAAPTERAERALDAMEEHLVTERQGLIRLLTPAFDRTPHDPGYIKGYLPGVRENGGQYTHAALWAVRALAQAGRRERAARLLEMLSPVSHARTPDEVARYQVEPYVIAADVYGVEPHVGRGGWTWYTGSAGWMYRVALESILGLDLRGGNLIALQPCIPDDWKAFSLRYRLPDGETTFRIDVRRATASSTTARLDGEPLEIIDGAVLIPLARDGAAHQVTVELGEDVGPRYRSRVAPDAVMTARASDALP